MTIPVDDVQQSVLEHCAEWGDAHPCLKQVYIFGSTAEAIADRIATLTSQ